MPKSEDIGKLDALPSRKKDVVFRWAGIIHDFEIYAKESGKRKRVKAMKDFCLHYRIMHPEDKGFGKTTLRDKIDAFNEYGIVGLAPDDGKGGKSFEWCEQAKACLKQIFLNINAPPISWCIQETRREAKKNGWNLPCDKTMYRYLNQIPKSIQDFHRRGEKYHREHWIPSALRDYRSIVPGQIYVADHYQVNVAVRMPSGKVLFPWLTLFMDMRTRKIVGWCLSDCPSGETIRLAFLRAIKDCGSPQKVLQDNGRDFSGLMFTSGIGKRFRFRVKVEEFRGIYSCLGIDLIAALPGNPQTKPVERLFKEFRTAIELYFPTYRGPNVQNRIDGVDSRIKSGKDIPEWEYFLECMKDCIQNYNQNHHHTGHGMDGRTPNEVWNEYFAKNPIRRVSPESLRLLMMPSKLVKVGRFGISAFDTFYRSEPLMDHQGSECVYRFNPDDLSEIIVYAKDGRFLCTAQRIHRPAFNDTTGFKERKGLEKRLKKVAKEELEVSKAIYAFDYGYKKHDLPEDAEQQPEKLVRLIMTPLDGVQHQIDRDRENLPAKEEQQIDTGKVRRLFPENEDSGQVNFTDDDNDQEPRQTRFRGFLKDTFPRRKSEAVYD